MNLRERIPQDLLYRVYENSLAVVMNVKENRVILLQNEPPIEIPSKLFKKYIYLHGYALIDHKYTNDTFHPLINETDE